MLLKRMNKQTKEVVIGTFDEIADYDKRLWTEPEQTVATLNDTPITAKEYAKVVGPDPLCKVLVARPSNNIVKHVWVDIYYDEDLKGIYL